MKSYKKCPECGQKIDVSQHFFITMGLSRACRNCDTLLTTIPSTVAVIIVVILSAYIQKLLKNGTPFEEAFIIWWQYFAVLLPFLALTFKVKRKSDVRSMPNFMSKRSEGNESDEKN